MSEGRVREGSMEAGSSPYLVGRFWRLPAIIERRLVGWGLMACPVVSGERTKLSPLRSRLWAEEETEPSLGVF